MRTAKTGELTDRCGAPRLTGTILVRGGRRTPSLHILNWALVEAARERAVVRHAPGSVVVAREASRG